MEQTMERLQREAYGIVNTTEHFMLLAEKYVLEGDMDTARACLILLCDNCSNYEESLEYNDLTEQWNQYRYLVEGLVPPSVRFNSARPLAPKECSVSIKDILRLTEEDLLSALSHHLGELSGNGDFLSCLNKWERTAYYADELCVEVNSGGFDGYLYDHGTHFEKAYKAMQQIAAPGVLSIMDAVREKFPGKRIPKNEDALQNALDVMEEKNVDFENEEELFYGDGTKELLERLLSFVMENKDRFR